MKKSTKQKLVTGLVATASVLLIAGTVALGIKTKGFQDWKWAGDVTKTGTVVERFEITAKSELAALTAETTKSETLYETSAFGVVSDGLMGEEKFVLGAEESAISMGKNDFISYAQELEFKNSIITNAWDRVNFEDVAYYSRLQIQMTIDNVITDAKDDDSTLLKLPYFDVVRINFNQDVAHYMIGATVDPNAEEEAVKSKSAGVEKSLLNAHMDLSVIQPTKKVANPSMSLEMESYGLSGERDTRLTIDSIEFVKTSLGHAKEYRYVSFSIA